MTVEHQIPLFFDYPITVQFDRRGGQIAPHWHELHDLYRHFELAEQIYARLQIHPLQLIQTHASFSEVPDGVTEAGERDCYCYTRSIPFLGDRELWFLDPTLRVERPIPARSLVIESCLLEGEIFRQELIIAVLATDRSQGTRLLDERLGKIQRTIELQNRLICQFHTQLETEIERHIGAWASASAAGYH